MRVSADAISRRMSMTGSDMVVVYPRTGARQPVGCSRRPMQLSTDQAGPTRGSLLTYVDDLPRFGAREACLWREGVRWRRRTYAELHRRILACAAALSAAGLRRGEPVLIQGPDGADWVEALLGTFWAGGVAVPLEGSTPDDLRARIAARAGGRFLLAPPATAPPDGARRIDFGSWGNLAPAASAAGADPAPE